MYFSSVQSFSYVRLWNPMDCSTPGLLVHHQCLGPTQSYVPQVADAIQPSHPLSSPFPPAFNLSLASRSFPKNQFFTSGVQSIGASASASALSVNIQDWFPLGLTGLIFLQPKGLSRVFSNTTVQKHQFFGTQLSLLSHPYMTTDKTIALTRQTFVGKVISLLFNMLPRFVKAFLPKSKHLLFSWLQSLCSGVVLYSSWYCCTLLVQVWLLLAGVVTV